ncbi:hypothetical protein BACERE00193_02339 [Bacillus paranthracis]|uniref:Uncharacterized protein n=1 Tax=Bacillus paranthracis TaxID=2026186 RepID=A0A9X8SFF6_9BACI|nr:hypothetical protein BACERE00193_02339 [Bacillus paranthracis]SME10757.1 hypothetical protein BACERE00221_02734 [Bacillus paranthracis]
MHNYIGEFWIMKFYESLSRESPLYCLYTPPHQLSNLRRNKRNNTKQLEVFIVKVIVLNIYAISA